MSWTCVCVSRLWCGAAVFCRRPTRRQLSRFLQLRVVSEQSSLRSVRQTSETTVPRPAGQTLQQHLQQDGWVHCCWYCVHIYKILLSTGFNLWLKSKLRFNIWPIEMCSVVLSGPVKSFYERVSFQKMVSYSVRSRVSLRENTPLSDG